METRSLLSLRVWPAAINASINGALAWIAHGQVPSIGLWTEGAYGIYLLVTGFLLPSISWMIVRPLTRRQANGGKFRDLTPSPVPRLGRVMPTSLLGGALVIGATGTLLGAVAVLALQAFGEPSFSGPAYVGFKSAYSAMLSALLQPTLVRGCPILGASHVEHGTSRRRCARPNVSSP